MLRIVLLPSAYHPSVGGVEELTRRLAAALVDAGHDVQVWTSRSEGDDLGDRGILDGLEVLRFTFPLPRADVGALARWPLPAARVLAQLRRAARAFAPDVLHVQCFSSNGVYASALSKLLRIPLVVTLQGETVMDDRDIFTHSRVLQAGLSWGLRQATTVTACSQFTLDDAVRRFGADPAKSRVIFNGVGLTEGSETEPLDLPFDVFALAMGRVVRKKGFDLLLDACALLDDLPSTTGIVIGGDGPELEQLKAQAARLGLAERVVFPGRLQRPQVAWAMQHARCFVMPSRLEPFGIVVLEAWRAGTAVIASSIGGAPEFVKDGVTGLVVDPHDRQELADALGRLLRDRELATSLGLAGRDRVLAFDWAAIAPAYAETYIAAADRQP